MFSRTLTSVYDAILEDLVYPVEIVGKRIRVKLDGSQLIKVHLDKNEQTNIEHKVRYPLFSFSLYMTLLFYNGQLYFNVSFHRLTLLLQCISNWLDGILHSNSLNLMYDKCKKNKMKSVWSNNFFMYCTFYSFFPYFLI